MGRDKLFAIAAFGIAPFCCGGLALAGAGSLAFLGAIAAWQGFAVLAILAIIGAVAFLLIRRRRNCEP